MRKYIRFFIISVITIISINITVYANFDFSKVVNAMQKLPYLYDFIQEFFILNNSFSFVVFRFVRIIFEFILGIIVVSVAKYFVHQGASVVCNDIKKAFLSGVLAYTLIVVILILFFVSFVGFPIAILILTCTYITVIIFKVGLETYIGYKIEQKLKCNWQIYLNYLVGTIVIETFGFIPYVGQFILFCLVPIMSFGILIVLFLNKYIYKNYYKVSYRDKPAEKKYDRDKINDIIKKGIDK